MKKFILFVLLFLLTISFSACFSPAEKIDWTYIQLGTIIPEPNSNKAEIDINVQDRLDIDIYKISENDFQEYIFKCENEYGFTIDTDVYTNHFSSFNTDGYELSLNYNESTKIMSIELNAPEPTIEYKLPDFVYDAGLPLPNSKIGYWLHNNTDYFYLYVCETTIEEYKEYRDNCIDAGFLIDDYEVESSYSAYNEEGYYLNIRYQGYNRISIEMRCPKEEEIDVESEEIEDVNDSTVDSENINDIVDDNNVSSENTSDELEIDLNDETNEMNSQEEINFEDDNLVDGMRKEFKEAMDDYESFFDEYVDFMKKYNESTDVSTLLLDYAELMAKYELYTKSFEEWENKELNDAELAYYIQVQNRVSEKLLSIQ